MNVLSNVSSLEDFDTLQVQMKEFLIKTERALTDKRTKLINDKQDYFTKISELKYQEQQLKNNVEELVEKNIKNKQNLKNIVENIQKQKQLVDELIDKQKKLSTKKNETQKDINELNDALLKSKEELSNIENKMMEQEKMNEIELKKYNDYLSMDIVVMSKDIIKFVFYNLNPCNLKEQYLIDLSLENDVYKINLSTPPLNALLLDNLEQELNESQNLTAFLKNARTLFKETF